MDITKSEKIHISELLYILRYFSDAIRQNDALEKHSPTNTHFKLCTDRQLLLLKKTRLNCQVENTPTMNSVIKWLADNREYELFEGMRDTIEHHSRLKEISKSIYAGRDIDGCVIARDCEQSICPIELLESMYSRYDIFISDVLSSTLEWLCNTRGYFLGARCSL